MERFDKMLEDLRNSSGEMKSNLHLLDEIVPFEEQMKYFNYSKSLQSNKDLGLDKHYLIARLFTPDVDVEDKRYYLSTLAGMVDVVAYRAIETYHSSPPEAELANWSALALIESRILLNSELSGEKQFYLSTGLGGKENKLRFLVVIASRNRDLFTDYQRETMLHELQFSFDQNNIDVEQIEVNENYVKLFILSDLDHNPRQVVESAVRECNELGNFIDPKFIVTNIKLIDDTEIRELLKKPIVEKEE